MMQALTDAIAQAKRDANETLETFLEATADPYEYLDEDEVAAIEAERNHKYAAGFYDGLKFAQRLLKDAQGVVGC